MLRDARHCPELSQAKRRQNPLWACTSCTLASRRSACCRKRSNAPAESRLAIAHVPAAVEDHRLEHAAASLRAAFAIGVHHRALPREQRGLLPPDLRGAGRAVVAPVPALLRRAMIDGARPGWGGA